MNKKLNLTGVILCAGKGTRIKKLPFKKPKTLLEILGHPIIYYQLKYMEIVGIKKVFIVIGKNGKEIAKKVKSIKNLNLKINYVKDLNPKGIAHSLNKAKNYINSPILVFLGDIFLRNIHLKTMIKKYYNSKCSCVLGHIKENNIKKLKKNFTIKVKNNMLVKRVVEKPIKPETNLKGVGIYLFDKNIFKAIDIYSKSLNKSSDLGITESIQTLIDNNHKVYSSSCAEEDVNINEPKDLWETNIKLLRKMKKKNFISNKVKIGRNVLIKNSVIGQGVNIPDNSVIKNSVIFSNVKLKREISLISSIRTKDGYVKIK